MKQAIHEPISPSGLGTRVPTVGSLIRRLRRNRHFDLSSNAGARLTVGVALQSDLPAPYSLHTPVVGASTLFQNVWIDTASVIMNL